MSQGMQRIAVVLFAVVLIAAPLLGQGANASSMAQQVIKMGAVRVNGVEFVGDTATLAVESDRTLGEVVTLLKDHGEWRFEVQVHTDNAAAPSANLRLSNDRAVALVTWLTAHGIEASRLVAVGYGDTKPVADNTGEEGRAKNRRVVLKKLNEE